MQTAIYSKCGLSRHVPYLRGEEPKARHRRRHASAMENRKTVESWCEYRGVELLITGSRHPDVTNPDGWKWTFRTADRFAQWRPFAGRLSLKRNLRSGPLYSVKVYDYEQLLGILEWWLDDDAPE